MQQEAVLTFFEDSGVPNFKGTLATLLVPADQVAFERAYKTGMGKFEEEQRSEWILWLVWRCWRRETHEEVEFERFVEALESYDLPGFGQTEDTLDPTSPGEQPG